MSGFDFSLFAKGGPMIWVLVLLAMYGMTLFIERTLFLHRGQIPTKAFIDGIKNILAKRRLVEALDSAYPKERPRIAMEGDDRKLGVARPDIAGRSSGEKWSYCSMLRSTASASEPPPTAIQRPGDLVIDS